ncbi:hypothetical protein D3C80_2085840 [compost metagenome]
MAISSLPTTLALLLVLAYFDRQLLQTVTTLLGHCTLDGFHVLSLAITLFDLALFLGGQTL